MELYRITRTDPRRKKPQVQYGTMARVRAIERTVRMVNDDRDHILAWLEANPDRYDQWITDNPHHYDHVVLTVSKAVITAWEDVTGVVIKP